MKGYGFLKELPKIQIYSFALVLGFMPQPCLANLADQIKDAPALKADAQKILKEKVGPFVKKYCTRCHGSRAKAGINLQNALNNPTGESALDALEEGDGKCQSTRHAARRLLQEANG